jgi:hypothetical protein
MTNGLRPVAQRALSAVGLGVVLALSAAVPASAKGTPFFTVEISPEEPVAGEAFVVVVRTWDNVAHTVPARLDTAERLDGLLVLRSASGDSPDLAIALQYEAPDEFRAAVVVPTAGEWKLIAFPDRTGWASPELPPGYPDTVAITVRAANGGVPTIPALAGLAALMGIVSSLAILLVVLGAPGNLRSLWVWLLGAAGAAGGGFLERRQQSIENRHAELGLVELIVHRLAG